MMYHNHHYDYPVIKRPLVFCANCGGFGHVYKTCNHPITSYGIICYKLVYDKDTNTISPKYLMVQRKDSLSFVEFLRGKYHVNNIKYLIQLFSHMTNEEREKVRNNDFDTLWKEMWCKPNLHEKNKNFNKEYHESKERFDMLKKGVYINTKEQGTIFFNFDYILNESSPEFDETEWGFPKGRRNINEEDIACALREFREETNINVKNIRLCEEIKPLEEIFSGSNKVRYKHVYYIARFYEKDNDHQMLIPNNIEIKDMCWFNYNNAQSKIRDTNIERKELFKRLNMMVMKSIAKSTSKSRSLIQSQH